MAKSSTPVHFPFQHPVFGRKSLAERNIQSVYYYWWAFLRLNTRYIECCETGGDGDLNWLYQDFGDVRSDAFQAWWIADQRGARLFGEMRDDRVRILAEGSLIPDQRQCLTLTLPLHLPKSYLLKRVRDILEKPAIHAGQRGRRHNKNGIAKYAVNGQPNLAALDTCLKVYCFRRDNPELTLWDIGQQLPRFMVSSKLKSTDTKYEALSKKNALAAAVSRHLRKAQKMIDNTAEGRFI